jgi:hypothetical protein
MANARPPNGLEVTGPGGMGAKFTGPSTVWLLGFAIVAGAVIYSNYQIRTEVRAIVAQQTTELHHAIEAQTTLFQTITQAMSTISAVERREMKELCQGVRR